MIWDRRPACRVTHKPTGETILVRDEKLSVAKEKAIAVIRSRVAGPAPVKNVIRSYHLDPPAGVNPFVKDERTGERFEGSETVFALLDRGELERIRPEE